MNTVLKECILEEKCSYLPNQSQSTQYKVVDHCSDEYCSHLIEQGWRRFGKMFFRPTCHSCTACESIKIDVANFNFSKSQRRILKKNSQFKIFIQAPTMTQEHLNLFNKYHHYMHLKKGWDLQQSNAKNYFISFVDGHHNFGYEVLYFDQNKLIGVDLIDILPNGISSIYFFYDPDYEKYSLGTFSLLKQIEIAQVKQRAWIYLGYYVEGCGSLEYKARYQPYLTLQGRPKEDEQEVWYPSDKK